MWAKVTSPGNLAVALVFFFQAEDGIRDGTVTGVQTCALPIYRHRGAARRDRGLRPERLGPRSPVATGRRRRIRQREIGRASCRERVYIREVGGALQKKRRQHY